MDLNEPLPAPSVPLQRKPQALIGLVILSVVLAIIAVSMISIYYSKVHHLPQLKAEVNRLETIAARDQDIISTLQQAVVKLQQIELSPVLTKEEQQLLLEWKKSQEADRSLWQAAEAEHLVKMAGEAANLAGDARLMFTLLDQALAHLAAVPKDADLQTIFQQLSDVRHRFARMPFLNKTNLYQQLNALSAAIRSLPLYSPPFTPSPAAVDVVPETFWQKLWVKFKKALHETVIIQKNPKNIAPIVLPEEKSLIYQAMFSDIEQTKWALLYGQNGIYQQALQHLSLYAAQYFMPAERSTQLFKAKLNDLQTIKVMQPVPNVMPILNAFNDYFIAHAHRS